MAAIDAAANAITVPPPADIEMAVTKQDDRDPFLVAFAEPYDADNPKNWCVQTLKSYV